MYQHAVAVASLVALAEAAFVSAAPGEDKRDQSVLRRQLGELIALADAAAEGERGEAGLSLDWEGHFLKGAEGNTYVPFSVAIDEHSVSPQSFVVYVRVVRRGSAERVGGALGPWGVVPLAPGEMPVGGVAVRHRRTSRYGEASAVLQMIDRDRQALTPYAFEDAHFVDVEPGDAVRPYRLRRALAVPPGEYDVCVIARETTAPLGARTGVLARPLLVPDLAGHHLQLSSLIVAERMESLPAPLVRKIQGRRPYAIGTIDITPASGPSFTAEDEPTLVFQIYNASLDARHKPDVSVEYRVLKLGAGGEFLPVARLETQQFNARTLPADFDPRAGHELGVLMGIPVSALSSGTYRLEVTVTDTLASQGITGEVGFEVSAATAR